MTVRILKAEKDTYIQNKIINGVSCSTSNVGQAATLDLYKLYHETTTSSVELSRAFVKFNLDPVRSMSLDLGATKFFLSLKDIYHGQGVPSNFNLVVFPLAKEFTEGRGTDVVAYRDVDATNWLSSSPGVLWNLAGCSASGSLGDSNLDYYVSGVLNGISTSSLWQIETFGRGNEDMNLDVSRIVSGVLVGLLPDYGFRIGFDVPLEEDQTSYFVKRFATRHVRDPLLRPSLKAYVSDYILDQQLNLKFNSASNVFVYTSDGSNFFSSSTELTGSNCLSLTLYASAVYNYTTTSWSETHSASINHLTSAYFYFSQSFSGSQLYQNGAYQSGVYFATVNLNSVSDAYLQAIMQYDKRRPFQFLPVWHKDDYALFSGSYLEVNTQQNLSLNVNENNYVVNITNLKPTYKNKGKERFRVFVQDYNTELRFNKIPVDTKSQVFSNVHWRLIQPFTKRVIVDFDTTYEATRMSSDGNGMYFDFYMEDLVPNQIYEFEFMIVDEKFSQTFITDSGFKFKVEE